ncbi:MAG: ferrous iron transport protein B [Alphaproteobacteria bacterium]|nr:ferrous iron transport protein B [Alphaproteobacteria bacterium]
MMPSQKAPLLPPCVALVGNPNCGKTALFNALTGSKQKVANYPGVTVEHKDGALLLPQGRAVRVMDLPGTYSLRARSPDEKITRDIVLGHLPGEPKPDLILCVADATNLRLALRLVLELRSIDIPLVLVLNMLDIAKHRGIKIDMARLSKELGIPVVSTVAVRRGGTQDLLTLLDKELSVLAPRPPTSTLWTAPDRSALSVLQYEADRLITQTTTPPPNPDTITAKIDSVLLHPFWGLVLLLGVLFVMFQAVFSWSEPPMNAIHAAFDFLGAQASLALPQGLFQSFVRDGLINGVGAVVAFLPQILILFFFILLLEDSGYMARAAFLMDKLMGCAGLHGRAFIPLLSGFACAIPAIMAARVIDNRRDRLTTVLITPLMACSARIPVYTLIIGAFVPATAVWGGFQLQGLVMFGLYALGIVGAIVVSFGLRRIFWRSAPSEPFLLELPDYKIPNLRSLFLGIVQRGTVFLQRAGTIIAAIMMVVWALSSFPQAPKDAQEPAIHYSAAAAIGRAMEPIFEPVGFNWQINIALIPGMAAREVTVAAFGTVYSLENEGKEASLGSILTQHWSLATALALLAWFVFAPQCLSTLVTIKKETGSWAWMAFSFSYMFILAYLAAFVTYRAALLCGAGG